MWFVYIVKCKNGSFYTGITDDVARRFEEHKAGKGGRYTKSFGAEKLLYTENLYEKSKALKRERQIKGWSRMKKENLIKYGIPKLGILPG